MQNLNLEQNNIITDEGIKNMTQMENLNLWETGKITNELMKNKKKYYIIINIFIFW
jgi:hypothetical protein